MSQPRPEAAPATGPFLAEGARRLDEWTRLAARLPPLDAVVEVDAGVLSRSLDSLPDDVNRLLRLVDGKRTLRALVDDSGRPDLEAAALLVKLHEDGVLRVAAPAGASLSAGGTPGPDRVEWFADPAEARRAAQAIGPGVPDLERSRGPEPVRHGQAPSWVVGAVLLLAAAILLGPEWARRRAPATEEPGSPGPAAAAPVPAPPALAITEPVHESTDLPAAYAEAMSTGEARSRAGDFGAAAAAFAQASRVRETSQSRAALGRALSDAGRPAEALGELRRATELDPSNGDAWLALGQVQLAGGDPAGARASFERNLALDPDGRHAGEVRAALARLRP